MDYFGLIRQGIDFIFGAPKIGSKTLLLTRRFALAEVQPCGMLTESGMIFCVTSAFIVILPVRVSTIISSPLLIEKFFAVIG